MYMNIRGEYAKLKGVRNKMNKAVGTPEEAAAKSEFESYHVAMKERVKTLLDAAKAIEDEIYKVNQPVPHKYELVRLAAAAK
jgi:predicted nucleic acid-binding OB-fold protein